MAGCPIPSSMETVAAGESEPGPVYSGGFLYRGRSYYGCFPIQPTIVFFLSSDHLK
jgi:hypothetical protein